jgi:hypothetical protein
MATVSYRVCHVERSETSLICAWCRGAADGSEIESLASRASSAALQLRFAQNDKGGVLFFGVTDRIFQSGFPETF